MPAPRSLKPPPTHYVLVLAFPARYAAGPLRAGRVPAGVEPELVKGRAEELYLGLGRLEPRLFHLAEELGHHKRRKQPDDYYDYYQLDKRKAAGGALPASSRSVHSVFLRAFCHCGGLSFYIGMWFRVKSA